MYQNTRIKWPNGLTDWGPLNLESRGRGPAGVRKCHNFRGKFDFMMFMFPNLFKSEGLRDVSKKNRKLLRPQSA